MEKKRIIIYSTLAILCLVISVSIYNVMKEHNEKYHYEPYSIESFDGNYLLITEIYKEIILPDIYNYDVTFEIYQMNPVKIPATVFKPEEKYDLLNLKNILWDESSYDVIVALKNDENIVYKFIDEDWIKQ